MPERVSDINCNNSAVTLLHDNVIMKQNLLKTLGKPNFNVFSNRKLFNCILQQTSNNYTAMNKQIYSSKNNTFSTKWRQDMTQERFDGKVANSIKNPWSCWPDSPCGRCWWPVLSAWPPVWDSLWSCGPNHHKTYSLSLLGWKNKR